MISRKLWILWNRLYFKILGIKTGPGSRVCNKIYIKLKGNNNITAGKNLSISSGGGYNPLARNIAASIEAEKGAFIEIGDNVGLSSPCLWAYKFIKIGNNVKVGADVIIMDSDAHSLDYMQRRNGSTDRPNAHSKGITIEDDVLIGTRCIILKGVTIGARSVVGSGSVVTKSIPADCIAAGNPCKVIKYINEH